jgi:hypothetical protein
VTVRAQRSEISRGIVAVVAVDMVNVELTTIFRNEPATITDKVQRPAVARVFALSSAAETP